MSHSIAKEFKFLSLLKFALPTMIMMIFMSLYTIVDGIFVSRFVGTDALSAVNIVYPLINVILAVAIMLGTGGSAIIARRMGENDLPAARENFSLITVSAVLLSAVIGGIVLLFIDPLVAMLGATPELAPYCRDYLSILMIFAPASTLQLLFQVFFVTAGKPSLGLALTITAGVVNAFLDYLFIVPLQMGIAGAALATAIGYLIPAGFGLVFFFRKKSALHFTRPRFDGRVLLKSCFNGSSEMVTNISSGVITLLFNIIMLRYLGNDGVAAITIVLYAQFLLTALYMGFSMGVAPVISYNHGSQNFPQLKRLVKICGIFILVSSVAVFCAANLLASGIVAVFSPPGSRVYDIAITGFILFSFSYLFAGVNIFSSALFTSLSNGTISAVISFLRTFAFIIPGVLLLPQLFGVDGIWIAVPAAELLTLIISVVCILACRKRYHY